MKRMLVIVAALAAACGGSDAVDHGPNEPNDTAATATPLTVGTPVAATLWSPEDVDYYAFTVPANGANVRLRTFDDTGATCNGVDTYLEVYDSTGTLVAFADDTFDAQWNLLSYCEDERIPLATGGTAWVAVGGYRASGYTLLVTIP